MHDMGAPPDWLTYANAMAACERAQEWHQVLRIMDHVSKRLELFDLYPHPLKRHSCGCQGIGCRSSEEGVEGTMGRHTNHVHLLAASSPCGVSCSLSIRQSHYFMGDWRLESGASTMRQGKQQHWYIWRSLVQGWDDFCAPFHSRFNRTSRSC